MTIEYRPITAAAIAELCNNIRTCDFFEAANSYDGPLENAVIDSVLTSCQMTAIYKDKKLMCLAGLSRLPHGYAPWVMGTKEMGKRKHARDIIIEGRKLLADMQQFGYLANYVQSDNHAAIRLLRHLGFKFGQSQPMFHRQVPFTYFYKEP